MLAWIDLETTGLDPHSEVILEVGVVITDDNLLFVDECRWLVTYDEEYKGTADDFVKNMHESSGLWTEAYLKGDHVMDVESAVCQYVFGHLGETKPPLAGSSVHFDRSFLAVHMPCVLKKFSYRNLDVSSIKEAVKLAAPELSLPPTPDEDKPHRALDDLHHSIQELQYYNSTFFHKKVENNVVGTI